jgi:hypothetical protein
MQIKEMLSLPGDENVCAQTHIMAVSSSLAHKAWLYIFCSLSFCRLTSLSLSLLLVCCILLSIALHVATIWGGGVLLIRRCLDWIY